MSCPFGRGVKDLKHPTCASCQDQGEKCSMTKRQKTRVTPGLLCSPVIDGDRRILVCYEDLVTPNKWTSKRNAVKIYAGERRKWERVIKGGGVGHMGVYLWGKGNTRALRHMEVRRFVPQTQHLFRDKTNIEGSLKPLEDALVNAGILFDDSEKYLKRVVTQEVDSGNPRVEIEIWNE